MQPSAWLTHGGFFRANNCNVFEKKLIREDLSTKETNFTRSYKIFQFGSRKMFV